MATDPNTAAWQTHALQRLNNEPPGPREIPARMQWTRTSGLGPGAEIFGDVDGRRVIELGCGAGHNIAHLVAEHGAIGTGVDVAWGQVQRARRNYGHLRGLILTVADACTSLEYARHPFDVCYSVFGAVGLVPPLELFALIVEKLAPQGVLAFSVIQPDRLGQTCDAGDVPHRDWLQLPDGERAPILRYTPERARWLRLVEKVGLTVTDVHDVADQEGEPDTLIVIASKT